MSLMLRGTVTHGILCCLRFQDHFVQIAFHIGRGVRMVVLEWIPLPGGRECLLPDDILILCKRFQYMQLVPNVANLIKKSGLFGDDMMRILGSLSSKCGFPFLGVLLSELCFFIQHLEEFSEKFDLFVCLGSLAKATSMDVDKVPTNHISD